jgi:hypothetical protein
MLGYASHAKRLYKPYVCEIEAQFIDKYKYQNSDLKLNKTKDSLDEKEGWASGTVPKVPKNRRDNFLYRVFGEGTFIVPFDIEESFYLN